MKCLRCGAELPSGSGYCVICRFYNPNRQGKTAEKITDAGSTYRFVPDQKHAREKIDPGKNTVSPGATVKHTGNPTVGSQTSRVTPDRSAVPDRSPVPPQSEPSGGGCLGFVVKLVVLSLLVGGIYSIWESAVSYKNESKGTQKKPDTVVATETVSRETLPEIQTDYTFYSISSMKDTLAPTCIDEDLNVIIRYMGDTGELYQYAQCFLFGGRSGSLTELQPGVFRLIVKPYAGSKMLKAYRTGDYSDLTEDEIQALYVAESVVDMARREANNDMELEQWLHDWMCENISYYDVDFSIEFTDRRQLNAVGALLDGKANCQGYTDCFYLLGNMAGFTVDRQVMPEHIFNTIKLSGNWYIVDVTHNDLDFEQFGREHRVYQYFNVGMDYCDDRSWAYQETRNTISQTSGSYFYYNQAGEYPRFYYSLEELAASAIREYRAGRKEMHMMLYGQKLTHEDLFPYLDQIARQQGVRYNIYVSYSWGIQNTCYILNFE